MPKILGMAPDEKWHEVSPVHAGKMQLACNRTVVRAVAYARADSPVVLFKDVCPKCRDHLLVIPEARNA